VNLANSSSSDYSRHIAGGILPEILNSPRKSGSVRYLARLKCTTFDFGWGYELTALRQASWLHLRDLLLGKGSERKRWEVPGSSDPPGCRGACIVSDL